MHLKSKVIIIGTEKTISSTTPRFISDDGSLAIVSAYGLARTAEYYVESCAIVNPLTGCEISPNPLKNAVAFEKDFLYPDIERVRATESTIGQFSKTFADGNLEGSEFAAALAASVSEELGDTPCVIIHPNETNLLNFCRGRFKVLIPGPDNDLKNM